MLSSWCGALVSSAEFARSPFPVLVVNSFRIQNVCAKDRLDDTTFRLLYLLRAFALQQLSPHFLRPYAFGEKFMQGKKE